MTNDQDDAAPAQPACSASIAQTRMLGLGLVALALLLVYLLLLLWPSGFSADAGTPICPILARACFFVTVEVRLLMIVMVAGALGSFIHTATSFGDFVGNNKLSSHWMWWYILRPFIGTALAAIFYLMIRGGFLASGTQAQNINLYGVAALAGMVGMFSKQATDKLGEVFDSLFKTSAGGGDARRKDALANPVPAVASIEPAVIAPSGTDGDESGVDGCDVEITAPTADEDLPVARGGVAA